MGLRSCMYIGGRLYPVIHSRIYRRQLYLFALDWSAALHPTSGSVLFSSLSCSPSLSFAESRSATITSEALKGSRCIRLERNLHRSPFLLLPVDSPLFLSWWYTREMSKACSSHVSFAIRQLLLFTTHLLSHKDQLAYAIDQLLLLLLLLLLFVSTMLSFFFFIWLGHESSFWPMHFLTFYFFAPGIRRLCRKLLHVFSLATIDTYVCQIILYLSYIDTFINFIYNKIHRRRDITKTIDKMSFKFDLSS